MKLTRSSARCTSILALLATLPTLAHAHPGHSALDWFSAAPHSGHESEYAVLLSALAIVALAGGLYWLGSRKR
jgi:hypothetical protein